MTKGHWGFVILVSFDILVSTFVIVNWGVTMHCDETHFLVEDLDGKVLVKGAAPPVIGFHAVAETHKAGRPVAAATSDRRKSDTGSPQRPRGPLQWLAAVLLIGAIVLLVVSIARECRAGDVSTLRPAWVVAFDSCRTGAGVMQRDPRCRAWFDPDGDLDVDQDDFGILQRGMGPRPAECSREPQILVLHRELGHMFAILMAQFQDLRWRIGRVEHYQRAAFSEWGFEEPRDLLDAIEPYDPPQTPAEETEEELQRRYALEQMYRMYFAVFGRPYPGTQPSP